jgi:hypothetical protein
LLIERGGFMKKTSIFFFLPLFLIACEASNPIECRGTNGVGVSVNKAQSPDNGDFVKLAYRVALQREADPDGLLFHCKLLNAGKINRADLVKSFLDSNEGEKLTSDKK